MGARVLRNVDLAVLGVALPLFAAADLPLEGWVAAAAVWLLQRAIQVLLQRRADASDDPRVIVYSLAGGAVGRGILTAVGILVAGFLLGDRAGLAAALLIVVLFTVHFSVRLVQRGLAPGQ